MLLREYKEEDCPILADLFYNTVHYVNKKDYTKEQLNAWANGKISLDAWNTSFSQHYSLIVEIDKIIVGFGDMTYDGYLDRLYVHKDYLRLSIKSTAYQRNEHISLSFCKILCLTLKGSTLDFVSE